MRPSLVQTSLWSPLLCPQQNSPIRRNKRENKNGSTVTCNPYTKIHTQYSTVHNFTDAETLAHTIQQSYVHCTSFCTSLVKQSVAYTDCPDLCDRWGNHLSLTTVIQNPVGYINKTWGDDSYNGVYFCSQW